MGQPNHTKLHIQPGPPGPAQQTTEPRDGGAQDIGCHQHGRGVLKP